LTATKKQKLIKQLVYIGPTLSEGRLSFATVVIGGTPAHLQDLLEQNPWFTKLFVPVSKMEESIKATKEKGSYFNILYNKAKEV